MRNCRTELAACMISLMVLYLARQQASGQSTQLPSPGFAPMPATSVAQSPSGLAPGLASRSGIALPANAGFAGQSGAVPALPVPATYTANMMAAGPTVASQPGQGLGLTATYFLTTDRITNSPESGRRLGIEIGKAAVEFQRTLDQYTAREATNTLRVIKSHMLEPQILVRVRIIEVNRTHFTDVGSVLSYIGRNPNPPVARPSFFGKPQNVIYNQQFPANLAALDNNGITINLTTRQIDDIITAVQRDFKSDIVAAPSVVAINDERVDLFAGSNIPFVYGRASTLVQTERMQQAAYKDVGLHLQVLPHIITRTDIEQTFDLLPEGRALQDQLRTHGNVQAYLQQRTQMVESALATESIVLQIGYRIGKPDQANATIKLTQNDDFTGVAVEGKVNVEGSVRASTTRVRVRNGCGMVIGGIITELASDTENKVPVLGDIPLLGNLFRRKVREREKVETLIFLEASVVDPAGDSLAASYEYGIRHLPNGPAPGTNLNPPFSQVPLTPLEGHLQPVLTKQEVKEGLIKPIATAREILK